MRKFVLFTSVIAIAAVLATPASLATWYAFGTHEPDNGLDSSDFMWTESPPEGSSRIYFNAVTTVLGAGNPNVGVVGTTNEIPTEEYHTAMLGVWKDCNGDGYVGMAESAIVEYSSSLLTDDTACPALTGPQNSWPAGAHNYNGWVTELVPIAGVTRDSTDDNADLRVYRDPAVMVWGDYGAPTDGADVGGTCAIWPQPLGTYHSTGATINFFDCLAGEAPGLMETSNGVWHGRRLLGQDLPGVGADPLGLTFENDDDARGDAFWDRPTFGSENSDNSAITVVDCDADPMVNESGVVVPALAPGADPNGATLPGTVNETNEELVDDCDTSNDSGNDFYAFSCQITYPCIGEGEFQGVSATRKTEADWNLQFTDYTRGRPLNTGAPMPPPAPGGSSGIDPYLGLQPVHNAGSAALFNATSMWESGSVTAKTPSTVRASLAEGTVEIDRAYILSFYAHVGSVTTARGFALPSAQVGEYGAAHCSGIDTGIVDGWECDSTLWYYNQDGTKQTELYPYARPGQSYELRDIDCYDGQTDANVAIGAPAYGPQPCS